MRAARSLLVALAFSLGLVAPSQAADHTTAACASAAAVQTAMNAATENGARVILPLCTVGAAWTSTVTWNAPPNAVLIGAGTSAVGGGDQTVVIDNVGGNVPLLNITTNASGTFRLTGITFRNGTGGTRDNGPITIGGSSKSFRMDHFRLQNMPGNGQVIIDGWIYGVIDHFISDSSGTVNAFKIFHAGWNGGDSINVGDASWADDTTFGSNRFVFIEDGVFNGGVVNDCSSGGRFVIRRNTITTTASLGVQTHPTGGGARHRGCRAHEIYQNTFVAANNSIDAAVWISSGTALVWGNTISQSGSNNYARFIKILSMRFSPPSAGGTYSQTPPPGGWGYCGTSFGPSNFDQNTDATGNKCIDDPGVGKGDLLNSDFQGQGGPATGPSNAATGCNSTQACVNPRQAAEPVYEWLNTIGATTKWTASGSALQINRDYATATTGTSLPGTCTTLAGFWLTTTSTFYKCTATNVWTSLYTPYTYPHPLVAAAPIYYVDAQNGNDANNGLTVGAAWLTLNKAATTAVAGDTVRLRGTFTGQQLVPANSGTSASAPIIYETDPGQPVAIISGGSGNPARGVILLNRSFITIRNLQVQDVNAGYSHAIVLDGSNDNEISGNNILRIGTTDDQSDSVILTNSSRNRLINNWIQNAGHSLFLIGNQNSTADSADNVVSGNLLENAWGTGVSLLYRSLRTIVEDNVIRGINTANTNATSASIQLVSNDNVIRRNRIYDNLAPGISIFAYIFSAGVNQDAINNQIYHNVFYGSLASGATGGAASILISEKNDRSVSNNLIANNIFYRNAGNPFGGQNYQIWIDHTGTTTAWPVNTLNGNTFKNNIILRQPGAAGEVMVLRVRTAGQGGNLSYTLPQFQVAHGAATVANLELDPLFTDETNRVFTLQATSPAINTGLVIAGQVFNGSAPDIGRYETTPILRTYTTSFPLAENPLSESGNWINGQAQGTLWRNCRTMASPNRVIGTQGGADSPPYNDSVCLVTGAWGADQTAQGTIYRVNPNANQFQEVELHLRGTGVANNWRGYEINIGLGAGTPYTQIVRWNGGLAQRSCANGPAPCFTILNANATAWANGNIVRATVTGTSPVVITVFKSTDGGLNFSQVLTASDSGDANGGPWTSGAPGVGFFRQNQSDSADHNADYGFTCFSATDSGTPAACTALPPAAPSALTITSTTSTTVRIAYLEPTTVVGGGPLADLQKTTITYQIDGGPLIFLMDVTASSPSGGGTVVRDLTTPIPLGYRQTLTIIVTAANGSGGSGPTQVASLIDRKAEASSGVRR